MSSNVQDIRFLQLLYHIGESIHTSEDPQAVMQSVLVEVVRYFEVGYGTISLFNPGTHRLDIEAFVGLPENCREWTLPMGVGLTGWVALHNRSLLSDDVTSDSRYVRIVDGLRSVMAVPLRYESTTLGVLSLESRKPHRFSPENLDELEVVADALVRVLNRIWRVVNLKTKSKQLESVVKMVGKVSNRFELDGILADLTSEARRIINCEMCSLFLLRSPDLLELEVLIDREGRREHNETVSLQETSMGAAVTHCKIVEVSNLAQTEEHHFIGLDARDSIVGMLCTPLVYEEQVIGVLNAYTSVPYRFSNTEKQVFGALADIGAFAIENSKLYTRIMDSENLLRQSERLTTLGTLASEIAHEIRNPLTVIRLLVESLSLDIPESDPRNRDIKVVTDNIDNLGEIVGRVLDFGKSQSQIFGRWNTHDIVNDCIRLVRFKLRRSQIKVTFLESDNAVVNCNKGQIQQVFLNLFINAEEAMPNGGEICIRSHRSPDGHQIFFDVCDTGTGIPEPIREVVFESFLTGKSNGTGLGLAIVKRILRDHRGNIEILESSERGTTFRFWLPVHAD